MRDEKASLSDYCRTESRIIDYPVDLFRVVVIRRQPEICVLWKESTAQQEAWTDPLADETSHEFLNKIAGQSWVFPFGYYLVELPNFQSYRS